MPHKVLLTKELLHGAGQRLVEGDAHGVVKKGGFLPIRLLGIAVVDGPVSLGPRFSEVVEEFVGHGLARKDGVSSSTRALFPALNRTASCMWLAISVLKETRHRKRVRYNVYVQFQDKIYSTKNESGMCLCVPFDRSFTSMWPSKPKYAPRQRTLTQERATLLATATALRRGAV